MRSGARTTDQAAAGAPEVVPAVLSARRPGIRAAGAARLPGVMAAAGIALVATALGGVVPVIGAPVLAIVAGIGCAAARPASPTLGPGLAFVSKGILQGSIVVLGLNLSLSEVVSAGRSSLPVLVGTLVLGLGAAAVVGRALRLRPDITLLVGVGTAVCGASAIAATDAVIAAEDADVSYAVATIFAFNVVAVLAYPSLGRLLGLSQHAFGLWAGTAINDMSSVVAATTVYGHGALAYGLVVKLTRTLAIIPICLGVAAWRNRRATPAPGRRRRPSLLRVFPVFIGGFVAAVAVNSAGLIPSTWHQGLGSLASWMITAALAAVGLSTRPRAIRAAGGRPMLLGAILWATVGLSSLGLQALATRF